MDVKLPEIVRWMNGSQSVTALLPDVTIRQVTTERLTDRAPYLWVALPDQGDAVLVDEALERGAAAVVAEERVPSQRAITWLSVRESASASPVEAGRPVGLIVPDARQALLEIASGWRERLTARVTIIGGPEALRSTQRLVASVLAQRFSTSAPDQLLCDPIQSALALLDADVDCQRLVLRVDLTDSGVVSFARDVIRPDTLLLVSVQSRRSSPAGETELLRLLTAEQSAILNRDDPMISAALAGLQTSVLTFGLDESADVVGSAIDSQGKEGIRLGITYQGESIYLRMPLLGRASAHLTLAAAAAGLSAGESWEEIVAGLRTMSEQLQLLMTPGLNQTTFLEDSYDATPSSVLSVLHLLEGFPGRKVVVLGDLSSLAPQQVEGHRKVGRRAMDVASDLLTVGELAAVAGQEAIACGMPADRVCQAGSNREVVEKLKEVVQPGDIILVTGAWRSHMKEIVDQLAQAQTPWCEV